MRSSLLVVLFLIPLASVGQVERSPNSVRLPECTKLPDLREALSTLERNKGFTRNDDYKFLRAFKGRCSRAKIRSGSNYRLHDYHLTDEHIFTIYEVTGGKGHQGGQRVGFVANSIYSRDDWRVTRGKDCSLSVSNGACLLPKRCRSVNGSSDTGYFQKLALDEFAIPAHCAGVGEDNR